MWWVVLEGEFRLRSAGGQEVPVSNRNLKALIGLCALVEPMVQRRSDLAAWIWPDERPASAGTSLRQLLTQARRLLGPEWVHADRDVVRLVGIQRAEGTGPVMPDFTEPPFCRARAGNSAKDTSAVAHALGTTVAYLQEHSPQALPDYLIASRRLLAAIPASVAADLVRGALPSARREADRAWLHFLLGYSLCMASALREAELPLKLAQRLAAVHGDGALRRQAEEMLLHRSILSGEWRVAGELVGSVTPFGQLVFRAHRGLHGAVRRLLQGPADPRGMGARERAVAALFCLTSGWVEKGEELLAAGRSTLVPTWDLAALQALGEGFSATLRGDLEQAYRSFTEAVQQGEFGHSQDFVRYGLEGQLRVAELAGDHEAQAASAARARAIRERHGFRVTAWDRSRLRLSPLYGRTGTTDTRSSM